MAFHGRFSSQFATCFVPAGPCNRAWRHSTLYTNALTVRSSMGIQHIVYSQVSIKGSFGRMLSSLTNPPGPWPRAEGQDDEKRRRQSQAATSKAGLSTFNWHVQGRRTRHRTISGPGKTASEERARERERERKMPCKQASKHAGERDRERERERVFPDPKATGSPPQHQHNSNAGTRKFVISPTAVRDYQARLFPSPGDPHCQQHTSANLVGDLRCTTNEGRP